MAEFKYSNIDKEMQVYGFDRVIKSHCRMCHGGCGVLVYIKNGKVAKIGGDPDCPINHGTLCSKGIASAQLVYHPDRLTYPVRRVGARAGGKWERGLYQGKPTLLWGCLEYDSSQPLFRQLLSLIDDENCIWVLAYRGFPKWLYGHFSDSASKN